MEFLMESLANPGEMTRQQWLLVGIMLFVVVGVAFFVWRLYKVVLDSRKNTYVPNIGRKRMAAMREDASVVPRDVPRNVPRDVPPTEPE